MAAYIETLNLMDNAVASEASDEAVWAEYALGASRLFDLLCDVEDNFFAKAETGTSEKIFFGNGIDMFRLPPFAAGSVTQVKIDNEIIQASNYRITGIVGAQFLFDRRYFQSTFDTDEAIKITARFGFPEIPQSVKIVVTELANTLWRFRDPLFAKISDVEITKEVSPTTALLIKKFRDRFHQTI